jgi:hypothetical protein
MVCLRSSPGFISERSSHAFSLTLTTLGSLPVQLEVIGDLYLHTDPEGLPSQPCPILDSSGSRYILSSSLVTASDLGRK